MRWWQRRRMAAEATREVAAHMEEKVADLMEAGIPEQEARQRASKEFGNAMLITETSREVWSWGWLDRLMQDLRYAARGLRRDPMLALTATLTLAICIVANTTVFSIVNSILLRPLPYPGAERIYWVSELLGKEQLEFGLGPDYYLLRERNRLFEEIAAFDTTSLNWTGTERPEQLDAARVTPSFFRLMGTQPMMGRYFAEDEQGTKAPATVVLSYALWRSRMGSDPHAVGKTIVLDRSPWTIAGVMPQGFDYPRGTQVFEPLPMDEATERQRDGMLVINMLAKVRRGVSQRQLDAEMARLTQNIRRDFYKGGGTNFLARQLQGRLTGDVRPALLVLSGAVVLVLLTACVNIANLLLARATARQRELAIRLALGSHRRRIMQQMVIESLMLAMPGGLIGAAVAYFAVRGLNWWQPLVLENYQAITMDVRILAFTFGLTALTGLVFGMAPAAMAAGVSVHDALKTGGLGHSGGRSAVRLRRLLVAAELSVSLVLLIGAGLLGRSFLQLAHIDLGFRPENLLTLRMRLAESQYATSESRTGFYSEVLERVKRLPMVRGAAITMGLPLGEAPAWGLWFGVAGRPASERPYAPVTVVSPDFFQVAGIPLRSGRFFGAQDNRKGAGNIIVNDAFVHKILRDGNPLVQQLLVGDKVHWTVVGVVGNVRGAAIGADPEPMIYKCYGQTEDGVDTRMALVVRTNGDPHAATRAVEQQIYTVDRNQPVFDVTTMDGRLADSLAPARFHLVLIGTFAGIALVLAALGVYGVLSYLVTRRTREIGIRIAMGARPGEVRRLIVGESVVLAALAVVAGLGGAWALTRYLQSMLYAVTALDGFTFAVMPAVLVMMAILAPLVPARRASRIDPMAALREE